MLPWTREPGTQDNELHPHGCSPSREWPDQWMADPCTDDPWIVSTPYVQSTGFKLTGMSRLGRLRVTTTLNGHASTQTTNVSVFSLDLDVFRATCDGVKKATTLVIDGNKIPVDLGGSSDAILFARDASTTGFNHKSPWKVTKLAQRWLV